MEQFDSEKAKRVWQRVQAGAMPPDTGQELQELVAREMADSALYLQLSRRFSGKDGEAFRRLAQEEQSHASILKGICALTTGSRPNVRAAAPEEGPAEVLLRRCCGREMQALAEYGKRSDDPQYGSVFRKLAEQEQAHCRTVLEILGRLEQHKPGKRPPRRR